MAVAPLVVTPGASFTLVSARGLAGDRPGAWATIAGTAAGIVTHAVLAGVGLAVVVMRSAQVYQALRIAGAAYLIGLGLVLLLRGLRGDGADPAGSPSAAGSGAARRAWQAYVANVLNVKAASVYLTLAPQFVAAEGVGVVSMLWLAGIHVGVMILWLGLWASGLTSLTARLDPRRWVRRIDASGGAVLILLGLRNARSAT